MAIAFVSEVCSGNNGTAAINTLVLTVGAGGAAVGDTVILYYVMGGARTATSVVDSKGNTWTIDATQLASSNHGSGVCSSKLTTALVSGDTITVTFNGTGRGVGIVLEFSGVDGLDLHASATQSSTTYDSGLTTGGTTTASSLLIGAVGQTGGLITITPNASYGWTEQDSISSVGSFTRSLHALYAIHSDGTGTNYQNNGTLASSAQNSAIIAVYKATSSGPVTVNITGSAASTSSGTESPSAVGVVTSESDATSSGAGTLTIVPTYITGEADGDTTALVNHDRMYITVAANASSSASSTGGVTRTVASSQAVATAQATRVSIYSSANSGGTSTASVSHAIKLGTVQADAIATGELAYTLTRIVVESDAVTSGSALPTVSGLLQVTGIANAIATADVALAQQISEAFAAATTHAVAMTTVFGNTKYNPQRRS